MHHSPREEQPTLPPTPPSAEDAPTQTDSAALPPPLTGEYGALEVKDPHATHGFTPSPLAGPLPQIPGYEIHGELGRGGMGVVYKARQEKLNRLVALKMVLGSSLASTEARIRFMLEGEVLGRLQHPNIVQIYEVDTFERQPFFALEYVEGGTLADLLKAKPTISPTEAAELVETLAHAVHYAHSNGVIHRDLKPANILLRQKSEIRKLKSETNLKHEIPNPKTDKREVLDLCTSDFGFVSDLSFRISDLLPKVTDFGLAKQTTVGTGLTASGAMMGTPAYMAPEQAEGKIKQITAATDVYALGAILYELLAGRPPFVANTPYDVIVKVMNEEPPSVSSLRQRLPRDLVTICHKCLQKDPGKRYATAEALAEDLQRFLEHKPITARPVGSMERLGMWIRRHPSIAALWAAGIVAVIGVLLAVVWFQASQQRLRDATRATELVNALTQVDTMLVPRLLDDWITYQTYAEPILQRRFSGQQTEKARLHTCLALLLYDPHQQDYRNFLYKSLLTASPAELLVVRDRLRRRKYFPLLDDADQFAMLRAVVKHPQADPAQRLRAAGALAFFAPGDPALDHRWVADELTKVSADSLVSWRDVFRPVRLALLPALQALYQQPLPTKGDDAVKAAAFQQREATVAILADYAADQPTLLTTLLLTADRRQHATLYPALVPHRTTALPLLLAELAKSVPENAADQVHDAQAQRQANVAALLLLLNHAEPVWLLFRHAPDPSRRSYLVHRCAVVGVDPQMLWQRFLVEKDVSAQRALVLALGEYTPGFRSAPSGALLGGQRTNARPNAQNKAPDGAERNPGWAATALRSIRGFIMWTDDDRL